MARYYPVSPLYWADDSVMSWTDATKLLSLYLLTCEHRNLEGLYRLPMAYIQADLDWDADKVAEEMGLLMNEGFIDYDAQARVVFLPKALKYHQPKTGPQVQGAINALQGVPETCLWVSFLEAAQRFAPELHIALLSLGEGHGGGDGNGMQ